MIKKKVVKIKFLFSIRNSYYSYKKFNVGCIIPFDNDILMNYVKMSVDHFCSLQLADYRLTVLT